jgi:nitroimidazol reductase NimA-like FMN-containing flavoprotein (pyridoxamine 5'-phosphate oxidase superfamily)
MTELNPTSEKNLDGYGSPPIAWPKVLTLLEETWKLAPDVAPASHWLATTDPDGRPHSVPIGAAWVDGTFYFTSGSGTRKSRNLAHDPRCTMTVSAKGMDIAVEGEATRVTDEATLQHLAAVYTEHGWSPTVKDGAFVAEYSAPSAGPAPWHLYEMTPTTIYGLATGEPSGATRWRVRRQG